MRGDLSTLNELDIAVLKAMWRKENLEKFTKVGYSYSQLLNSLNNLMDQDYIQYMDSEVKFLEKSDLFFATFLTTTKTHKGLILEKVSEKVEKKSLDEVYLPKKGLE